MQKKQINIYPRLLLVLRCQDQTVPHKNLHMFVKSISQDQVVCHADTMRLHGMVAPVVCPTNVTCTNAKLLIEAGTKDFSPGL